MPHREELGLGEACEQLRRLPFRDAPFSSRSWGNPLHRLCSYPSRLKPAIASTLVDLFTREGDVVVDPFCGVGTVPFEAALRGRDAVGGDLSPLAAVISEAKLLPVEGRDLEKLLQDLDLDLRDTEADGGEPEIATFYHERTYAEVCATRAFLIRARAEKRPGASLASAAMLHLLHGNRPYALSRRSHNVIPIPPKGEAVYKPVLEHLRAKLSRHASPWGPDFRPGRAVCADARELARRIGPQRVVITSPPFLGSTQFLRQNRIRLWFVGWDYARQESAKGQFLEHRRDRDGAISDIAQLVRDLLVPGGIAVMHLGVVRGFDMGTAIVASAPSDMHLVDLVYEDTSNLESHGRTDRGGTAKHVYAVMQRR